MTKIILLGCLFLCSVAHAAPTPIKLAMKIVLGGKLVSGPVVIVEDGKTATITDGQDTAAGREELTIRVKPTLKPGHPTDQILVELEVRQTKPGAKPIELKQAIMALEGEEAKVSMAERNKAGNVVDERGFSVIATKN